MAGTSMDWRTIFDGILDNLGLGGMDHFALMMFVCSAMFFVLAVAAAFQLTRIQCRVATIGCTTQKLFHFLVLFATLLRAVTFVLIPLFMDKVDVVTTTLLVLWDIPELVFFTTYSLLVVFWAEIYYFARNQPPSTIARLRPVFICVNLVVYISSVVGWLLRFSFSSEVSSANVIAFLRACRALVILGLAGSYILFGGRLFFMLRRFPIESRIRQKKLHEVGLVTTVCTLQFLFSSAWNIFLAAEHDAEDVWWVMGVYYFFAEILPTAMVLGILRQLPPRRFLAVEDSDNVDLRESLI